MAAAAIAVAAFAIPAFGYGDEADAPEDVRAQIEREAGQMVDFESLLFTQLRSAQFGGPEGTAGVMSYRTIFGVEVNRVAVRGDTQDSLTQRGWAAIWLWLAFIGGEIGLIALGVWQLSAERSGSHESQEPATAAADTSNSDA
jgi:hypothetical protein